MILFNKNKEIEDLKEDLKKNENLKKQMENRTDLNRAEKIHKVKYHQDAIDLISKELKKAEKEKAEMVKTLSPEIEKCKELYQEYHKQFLDTCIRLEELYSALEEKAALEIETLTSCNVELKRLEAFLRSYDNLEEFGMKGKKWSLNELKETINAGNYERHQFFQAAGRKIPERLK